jgi:hypothetical protein
MDKAHKSNNPTFVNCKNLYDRCISNVKVKVVAYHAIEGTEGEYKYSFLTSTVDELGGQRHAPPPPLYLQERAPVHIVGLLVGPVITSAEECFPTCRSLTPRGPQDYSKCPENSHQSTASPHNNSKQNRQSTYDVTLRRFRATPVAVEKQWVLHIMSVCL